MLSSNSVPIVGQWIDGGLIHCTSTITLELQFEWYVGPTKESMYVGAEFVITICVMLHGPILFQNNYDKI